MNDPVAAAHEGEMMRQWVLKAFILENHLPEWLAEHLR
jgi:hypothetical protein